MGINRISELMDVSCQVNQWGIQTTHTSTVWYSMNYHKLGSYAQDI